MLDDFSLDAIPTLTGYVSGAFQVIHQDIKERGEVTGKRTITITLEVDPESLILSPKVAVTLPKGDFKYKLEKVAMFRENDTLKIDTSVPKQQAIFQDGA